MRRSGAVLVAGAGLTGALGGCLMVRARPPAPIARPRLLDGVRQAIRARHHSPRTEKAYVGWIKRFIVFHGKRHPDEMGEPEVTQFLSNLATRGKVSTSTQNQALSALLFLYKDVLGRELDWLSEVVWAKRPIRLPVVLSREEVVAAWRWVFPATRFYVNRETRECRRHHLHESVLQRAMHDLHARSESGRPGRPKLPGLSIPAPWRALLQPLSC